MTRILVTPRSLLSQHLMRSRSVSHAATLTLTRRARGRAGSDVRCAGRRRRAVGAFIVTAVISRHMFRVAETFRQTPEDVIEGCEAQYRIAAISVHASPEARSD
jgi:hypothetical protein